MITFSWIDIFIGCVLISFGRKNTFIVEIFKFAGIVWAAIFAPHYYARFGLFLNKKIYVPLSIQEFVAFTLLVMVSVFMFYVIRKNWLRILEVHEKPLLDRWGSVILSIIRGFLICSLLFMGLFISKNQYLISEANKSLSGKLFKNASAVLYRSVYKYALIKVFPGEPINSNAVTLTSPQKRY